MTTFFRAVLTLGRETGCDLDEAEFGAWVAYVSERIDARCGFKVEIELRGRHDVQCDRVEVFVDRGGHREGDTISNALVGLWSDFCADESAWPAEKAS